ncbi:MAG: protein-disulfide reductase DsbD family protein [Parvibaculum sp.]|nr:protein-disulfide reductase DsbD family protein [Parvibaculum sp.]
MAAYVWHFLAAFFALFIFAAPVAADEVVLKGAGEKVTLIAGNTLSAEPVLIGLRMKMKPGWHTYWRAPGDSGIAPTFDWSASKNVTTLELLWPVPERFDAEGDITFGYAGEVIWPVLVRVTDPAKPLVLHLNMSYGVCNNICVPNAVRLALTVFPTASEQAIIGNAEGGAIRASLLRVPVAPEPPVKVTAKLNGEELQVVLAGVSGTPVFIPEVTRGFWFGPPQVSRSGADVTYKMPVEIGKGQKLKDTTVTMVFAGPETAIEAKVKVE